jgi:hypothetical protein
LQSRRRAGEASANSSRTTSRIDVRGPLEKRIKIRIIRGFGVGAEDRRVHLDVYLGPDLGQAAAALAFHDAVNTAPPEVLAVAGCLQLALDRHRTDELKIQSFKGGVVRP